VVREQSAAGSFVATSGAQSAAAGFVFFVVAVPVDALIFYFAQFTFK
jgi:hypothetical protein